MNINDAFESKYLKAADLTGPVKVTISHVTIEELGQGDDKDKKAIVYFQNAGKGLALNLTNKDEIEVAYGGETDDWYGKEIEIYPTTTLYLGKKVACLRVSVPEQVTDTRPEPDPETTGPPQGDIPF